MAKVTNEKKLEAVKNWLTDNNIKFEENKVMKTGLKIDLWIKSLFIAVHISDENDDYFYRKTHKWAKPFFVRDSETQSFVLEKIRNCAFDQMLLMQRKWQKSQKKNGGEK